MHWFHPLHAPATAGRQQGIALITVLLIVFLATAAAASLATVQQLTLRRSSLYLHEQQARLYALGGEQWAAALLKRDREETEIDTPEEEWAVQQPPQDVEGGSIQGVIRDRNGCFNVNNLLRVTPVAGGTPGGGEGDRKPVEGKKDGANEQPAKDEDDDPAKRAAGGEDAEQGAINKVQLQVLQRLLDLLDLEPGIALAIADWIDPDQEPLFPDGAEDSEYVGYDPPYLAANRPLFSISELRLIKGIDADVYDKLAPHVCALPPGTALNVNTADPVVLAAVIRDLRPEQLQTEGGKPRVEGYFESVEEFTSAYGIGPDMLAKVPLGVISDYFLVRVETRVGDSRAQVTSILERGRQGRVRVVSRSYGNDY